MQSLLEARDLYRFYHTSDSETLALRGVSLHLAAGELVVVMGPSGSGKSTLLACLTGLDEPQGGVVLVCGTLLTRRPEAERAALRAAYIGTLLQHGNLFDHLTIAQNIRVALQLVHHDTPVRLATLLEQVGLSHRRDAVPTQISGGEAARAGLAVALAAAPAVLVADEPTGEVDAATETQILAVIDAHCAAGNAALIVTHSAALAARANRVLHMHDGSFTHG